MSSPPPPALPLHEGQSKEGTPYALAQTKAADCMRVIREYISRLNALSPADDPTLRSDLLLRIRKTDNTLRRVMLDAKRYAGQEHKTRDLTELQHYFTATQVLVQEHYHAKPTSTATPFAIHDDEKGSGEGMERYDLRQDVEFIEFFAKTKERDQAIDVALDRIHEGVLRVNDSAHGLKGELQAQNATMRETDEMVDKNGAQMASMSRKMKAAVRKLGKSRLITYCVLCVILIVLIIVIAFLAKAL